MNPSQLLSAAQSGTVSNILQYIRRPTVALRLVSLLVCIILFTRISGSYTTNEYCAFNDEPGVCKFPMAYGVLMFFCTIGLLVCDVRFESISNIKRRKMVIIGDLALSGLFTFLWFVCFCLLANKWSNTSEAWLEEHSVNRNPPRTAIFLTFVLPLIWAPLTFWALQRFRMGDAALGLGDEMMGEAGKPSEPGITDQGYSGINDTMHQQGYPGGVGAGGAQQPPMGAGEYYGPTY